MGPKFDHLSPFIPTKLEIKPRTTSYPGVRRCQGPRAGRERRIRARRPLRHRRRSVFGCRRRRRKTTLSRVSESRRRFSWAYVRNGRKTQLFFSSFHLKIDPDTPARRGTLPRPPHALARETAKAETRHERKNSHITSFVSSRGPHSTASSRAAKTFHHWGFPGDSSA